MRLCWAGGCTLDPAQECEHHSANRGETLAERQFKSQKYFLNLQEARGVQSQTEELNSVRGCLMNCQQTEFSPSLRVHRAQAPGRTGAAQNCSVPREHTDTISADCCGCSSTGNVNGGSEMARGAELDKIAAPISAGRPAGGGSTFRPPQWNLKIALPNGIVETKTSRGY